MAQLTGEQPIDSKHRHSRGKHNRDCQFFAEWREAEETHDNERKGRHGGVQHEFGRRA